MNLHTNLDLTSFMAELGRIDEAKVYFAQATTIFESLGDVEKKKIMAAWCKEKFKIIID